MIKTVPVISTNRTEDALTFFRKFSKDSILEGIRNDLKEFRVEFDRWFSEASLDDDDSVNRQSIGCGIKASFMKRTAPPGSRPPSSRMTPTG